MKTSWLLILLSILAFSSSCTQPVADNERTPLLEVEGKFLYLDEVQDIIPPSKKKLPEFDSIAPDNSADGIETPAPGPNQA